MWTRTRTCKRTQTKTLARPVIETQRHGPRTLFEMERRLRDSMTKGLILLRDESFGVIPFYSMREHTVRGCNIETPFFAHPVLSISNTCRNMFRRASA